jgi:hypothetical protein
MDRVADHVGGPFLAFGRRGIARFQLQALHGPMFHKSVRYTLRQGIEANRWTVAVQLPHGGIEKRVQCSKQKADEIACAMIDKWLAENRPQGG